MNLKINFGIFLDDSSNGTTVEDTCCFSGKSQKVLLYKVPMLFGIWVEKKVITIAWLFSHLIYQLMAPFLTLAGAGVACSLFGFLTCVITSSLSITR